MDIESVSTRTVSVAGGRFAPGHLGELTQLVPFEMVDAALIETARRQSRMRDLPSRVVVYLLLAGCLFPDVGYLGVWRKLTSGLIGIPTAAPTPSALSQARRRIGAAPLRWLFDLLRGPSATLAGRGTWWRGLLVCAVDGTTMTVADNPAVLTRFTKQRGNHGGTGYPQVRLVALVACGTRSLIDAVFGPITAGETTYTPRLLRSLRAGMILLADRNFAAAGLLTQIAGTGAQVLVRLKNDRKTPVLRRYPDGSYLSTLGSLRVRVLDCEITISTTAGRHTGVYRLATTLTDHRAFPAADLIGLYHQRWGAT
ncbi:MAG: IS4 family transposase [Pseudonocardiaceae bacterium]